MGVTEFRAERRRLSEERGVHVGAAVKGTDFYNGDQIGIVVEIKETGVALLNGGRESHVHILTAFFEPLREQK